MQRFALSIVLYDKLEQTLCFDSRSLEVSETELRVKRQYPGVLVSQRCGGKQRFIS
jgi:hypothetical protein